MLSFQILLRACNTRFLPLVGRRLRRSRHPTHWLFVQRVITFIWSSLLLLSGFQAAQAQTWSFLVYGDTRGTGSGNQINTNIVQELVRITTNEKPAFVLIPGDLVSSGTSTAFQAWTHLMAPVYQAGIGVYPIMGNHDVADVAGYLSVFGPTIPDNGPTNEIDRTYFITYSNVLVLALDHYVQTRRVNQSWIDSILASNYLPHVFVFGHLPAFKLSHTDNLDDYPAERNTFWSSLTNHSVRAYFCGHDHFYDHTSLDDGDGNPANDTHQYIVGTGGAPLVDDSVYNGNNGSWTPQRILHEKQYGYLKVEINRLNVSITWNHRTEPGVYESTADTYSYYRTPDLPELSITAEGTNVVLQISQITPTASNVVEQTKDLQSGIWIALHDFTSYSNQYECVTATNAGAIFYRIRSE
jgi:3',5'-cyclic AMP phosphodiesterase CpdA